MKNRAQSSSFSSFFSSTRPRPEGRAFQGRRVRERTYVRMSLGEDPRVSTNLEIGVPPPPTWQDMNKPTSLNSSDLHLFVSTEFTPTYYADQFLRHLHPRINSTSTYIRRMHA